MLIVLFACAILCVFTGCAATITDHSKLQYQQDTFTASALLEGGLALLPVVAGKGQEGYRRPLADTLNVRTIEAVPDLNFMTWQVTMTKLNDAGLATTYADAISTYQQTAIIDRALLQEVSAALAVRYILFVSLDDFSKKKETTYSIWSGFNTTENARVAAFGQIWDCQSGDVVWEGVGAAQSSGGELTYTQAYETYASIAATGLVQYLPGSKYSPAAGVSGTPCDYNVGGFGYRACGRPSVRGTTRCAKHRDK